MKILPFLLLLPLVYSEDSSCLPYRGNYYTYRRSSILSIKGLPTNLSYKRNTNSLYFTLIDIETLQNDNVQTKMDQYVFKENELVKIDKINGQAVVIEEYNNSVYVATDRGLYTLDEFNEPEYLGLKNKDIVQLFKPQNTNDIYAIVYPENSVYSYDLVLNETSKVKNIDSAFIIAVDERKNIYYECDSKYVKVLPDGFQEPIEFVGLGKNAARAFAVNDVGLVILAATDGLYRLSATNVIPEKIMDLDFVPSGFTFDKNDIYIATTDVIYKFSKC